MSEETIIQHLRQFSDWDTVEAEVARIVETSIKPFAANTVSNTRDLVAICRLHSPIPIDVAKGYWSTISLRPNLK